jgi:hypothetical protein
MVLLAERFPEGELIFDAAAPFISASQPQQHHPETRARRSCDAGIPRRSRTGALTDRSLVLLDDPEPRQAFR